MNKKDFLNRLKIINPFLKKEKNLKDIASESGISYATLKRWVKNYKTIGEEGLKVKERNDKNSFRKADDSIIKIIENIYKKNKEKTLLELYQNFRANLEINISFNTFYRIVNNLDSYLKNKSKFQINKNLDFGDIYLIKSFISYHFVIHNNCKKLPIIFLAFNASTLDFIEYHIAFTQKFDNNFLAFLRKIIIKGWKNYGINHLPKEILIDSTVSLSKKIKEEILLKTGIKILEFEPNSEEINSFIHYLKKDLNTTFLEEVEYEKFLEFFDEYSKYYNLERIKNIKLDILNQLNIFLTKTIRKVSSKGIRINNSLYFSKDLKNYINKSLEITYDPKDNNYILVKLEKNEFKKIKKVSPTIIKN